MTELELLQAVRRRLAVEERWSGTGPHNDRGGTCLVVTLQHEADYGQVTRGELPGYKRLVRLAGVGRGRLGDDFNDTHSHADVVALLDRAIQECLAEQAAAGGIASESRPSRAKDSAMYPAAPPAAEPVEVV